jgi:hypothetical protein
MTLKEKFDSPIMRHDLGRNEIEETKEQCVEIAEEFAIGFAEWLIENKVLSSKMPTKELLEIYKKEL